MYVCLRFHWIQSIRSTKSQYSVRSLQPKVKSFLNSSITKSIPLIISDLKAKLETKHLCKHFNVRINYYSWIEDKYYPIDQFSRTKMDNQGHIIYQFQDQDPTAISCLDILLHTANTLKGRPMRHVILIKDVEYSRGINICAKYYSYFQTQK